MTFIFKLKEEVTITLSGAHGTVKGRGVAVRLSARLGQMQSTEPDQTHKPTRKGGR